MNPVTLHLSQIIASEISVNLEATHLVSHRMLSLVGPATQTAKVTAGASALFREPMVATLAFALEPMGQLSKVVPATHCPAIMQRPLALVVSAWRRPLPAQIIAACSMPRAVQPRRSASQSGPAMGSASIKSRAIYSQLGENCGDTLGLPNCEQGAACAPRGFVTGAENICMAYCLTDAQSGAIGSCEAGVCTGYTQDNPTIGVCLVD